MISEEPTLVISGRVSPKTMALALQYFTNGGKGQNNNGPRPTTRSELVYLVFELAAQIAKMGSDVEEFETNHDAIDYMSRNGIDWPGDSAQRDIQKARQFDVLADMSYEDAMALKAQIMDQRKKGRNLMPSATSSPDVDLLTKQFEEFEAKMKKDAVDINFEDYD